jgi:hypothetical protein
MQRQRKWQSEAKEQKGYREELFVLTLRWERRKTSMSWKAFHTILHSQIIKSLEIDGPDQKLSVGCINTNIKSRVMEKYVKQ